MILGILLSCTIPTDVSSCSVVAYEKKRFEVMAECQMEMTDVAKYTAENFLIMTRPYCFEIKTSI
tara:strand:- start:159 stop:353 length:195 start_codon:yes stop_codon:yes gene_type:complete